MSFFINYFLFNLYIYFIYIIIILSLINGVFSNHSNSINSLVFLLQLGQVGFIFHLDPVVDAIPVKDVPALSHSTHIIFRDDIFAANRAAFNLNWWSEVRVLSFLYLTFMLFILL
jgi:hypothetical protein